MTKDSEPVATTMQDRSEQSAPDTTETERTAVWQQVSNGYGGHLWRWVWFWEGVRS
jgi:hypothetical protein